MHRRGRPPPARRALNRPVYRTPAAPAAWGFRASATISTFMATNQIARRYFVSGVVQGVGFRYFTQDEAERLQLAGFVRNLRDGRVEVYAIGSGEKLARLRTLLERGPRGAMVQNVAEQPAEIDSQFVSEFSITYDS